MMWTLEQLNEWWANKPFTEKKGIAEEYAKPTLEGFRDYNTDDGEDWWYVGLYHALEATLGEMESWPITRVLNHTTGEISEGPLYILIDRIAEGVKANHDIRLEPKGGLPKDRLGPYWRVVKGIVETTRDGRHGELLIEFSSDIDHVTKRIPWPVTDEPLPKYVRPNLAKSGEWVVSDGPSG